MKCPLVMISLNEYTREFREEQGRCMLKECAWFDENANRCAVLEFSRLLNAAGNVLGNIAKELPFYREAAITRR